MNSLDVTEVKSSNALDLVVKHKLFNSSKSMVIL